MKRRLELAALAGILALAFLLRFAALSFGLDLADPERANLGCYIDERGMVDAVQDEFLRGSLDPKSFLYRGPAGFLVFGLVDSALIGARALTHPRGWKGRLAEIDANPSWLHLVHRCISAAAGVAGVLVLARLLRRELDAASGLLGGLFLAVAYLHVRESHFGTVDTLFCLTLLLALERMLAWIRAPSPGRAAGSGFLAGISAATKYFGVLLGAHLVLAHLFARKNAAAGSRKPTLWWALLAAPLGFLLVSPGLFVALGDFFDTLGWATTNYSNAGTAGSLLGAARFHVTTSLAIGLGEPAFLLALWGIAVAWKRGAGARFLVLALALLLPTLFLTSARPVRYGLPVLTLLAGCAGIGAAALLARTGPLLGGALVALSLAPSLVRSVSFDRLMARQDTRVEMLGELARRGVPAAEVLAIGWHNGLPIPAHRRPYIRYGPEVAGRRELTLEQVRAQPPRLILWDLTAPEWVVPERPALEAFVQAHYREVLRLDGRKGATELPYFVSPALMVPYARPWEMARPGSALVLFERIGQG